MVPAILVFRPSVGKRVIVLMPDSPPASLVQLSLLPAPSEVTTPSPVTTTTGRPILSLPAAIVLSSTGPLNECETFAAPMTYAGDDHLPQFPVHRPLQAGRVTGRKQTTTVECDRG